MSPFAAVFGMAVSVYATATLLWWRGKTTAKAAATTESAEDKEIIISTTTDDDVGGQRYLPVYLLAVASDWIRGGGSYAHELCSSDKYYGFTPRETFLVCSVLPFVASLVLGPLVCGPIADHHHHHHGGVLSQQRNHRKRTRTTTAAKAFVVVSLVSNLARHVKSFPVAVFASLLDGVATSLLFTVFDSRLAAAAGAGTPGTTADARRTNLFSRLLATAEHRNNLVAIAAGKIAVIASGATGFRPLTAAAAARTTGAGSVYFGGVLNPFDLSSLALVLCLGAIRRFWVDNDDDDDHPGDEDTKETSGPSSSSSWWQRYRSALTGAVATTIRSGELLRTGAICCLFETAMFVFAFRWTALLASRLEGSDEINGDDNNENENEIPFDLVFATFMVGCMAGTSVYTLLLDRFGATGNETIGRIVMLVATLACSGMVVATSALSTMLAFVLFEISVGMYFPMMGTMKAETVPEHHRVTIYNLYRVPFNAMMIGFLGWGEYRQHDDDHDDDPVLPFVVCAWMLGTVCVLQRKKPAADRYRRPLQPQKNKKKKTS